MEILSAAISLLALFVCLIILVPILLLIGLFVGYDKFSPQTQKIVKGLLNIIRKALKLPILKDTTTANNKIKPRSSKTSVKQVEKPVNVEDAEFREIKS